MGRLLMRVMLTADGVGGVWRYSLDLAAGFLHHGIEPTIAVLGPSLAADQRAEAAALPGLHVVETGLPLDWTASDPDALRQAAGSLAGLARRLGAERVHLHTPALAAEAPWAVPVVAVAHSCVATWWAAVRAGPLPPDLHWRAQAVGRGLAEADRVIAPTRAFAHALARQYRPGRDIDVVLNGAAPLDASDAVREAGVLTAGRLWDEGKNIAILDRVAGEMDVPMVAAGARSGPNGARIELSHLHAPGVMSASAVRELMGRLTVFAAPSRYEPFGLAVLEAAQSGMALALADVPTFRELWEGAAMFFHPDDEAGLRYVLRRLLEQPHAMAARARERARRYTVERMVDATLHVHRDLATSKAA